MQGRIWSHTQYRRALTGAAWATLLALAACQTAQPLRGGAPRPADGTAPLIPLDPPDSLPCKLDVVADLPLQEANHHLLVDVLINEKPARMILDTGAETTILSPDAAKRLSLDREGPFGTVLGIGGERKALRFQADSIRLGTLHGSTWNFVVADVVSGYSDPKPDGLLGADIFRTYDIDLNLPAGRLRAFYPEHDCSRPSVYLTGPTHSVDLEATTFPNYPTSFATLSMLRLHVKVGGQPLVAEIDTGAPHNIVFLTGLAKLKYTASDVKSDKRVYTIGIGPDAVRSLRHVLPELSIGDLEMRNVPVNLVNTTLGPTGPDIIIGLNLIKQLHIWISHSSDDVIFQYPPLASPPLPEESPVPGKT